MDEDLRQRFDRLRDEEAAGLPDYATFTERHAHTRPKSRMALRLWVAIPAVAAIALAFWLSLGSVLLPREAAPFVPGTWAMPTDILLRTPGSELLGAPPVFGLPVDAGSTAPSLEQPWRNSG